MGTGGRRLFFALWPDEAVRRQLAALLPGVRYPVPVEALHMTLAFLGVIEVEREACARVAAAGVRAARFDLMLDRAGFRRRQSVVWLAPSDPPAGLLALVSDLRSALGRCGFPPERRAYWPHMTLSRKACAGIRPPPPVHWPVAAFALVESQLGGTARYTQVERWELLPADARLSTPPAARP